MIFFFFVMLRILTPTKIKPNNTPELTTIDPEVEIADPRFATNVPIMTETTPKNEDRNKRFFNFFVNR